MTMGSSCFPSTRMNVYHVYLIEDVDVGLSYILETPFTFTNSGSLFQIFFFSYPILCHGRLSTKSNHILQMASADDDLEGGPNRSPLATCWTMFLAWASFLIWTIVIFLLIFGMAFYAFVRSNLPEVRVHRLDVYKLNATQPKNKNKDSQLTVDVQILVNVTNNNKKMMLSYGGMNVDTTLEGFSLPKVHVEGFKQKPKSSRDLKIRPHTMRSEVNEDDAKELKLSSNQHQMVLNVKMKGKIEFWYDGHMLSRLRLKVLCDGVQQSQVDQAIPSSCNVKLNPFS